MGEFILDRIVYLKKWILSQNCAVLDEKMDPKEFILGGIVYRGIYEKGSGDVVSTLSCLCAEG